MEQPDPQDLRISDADRHKVAEVLREAAGEGRIDLTELDERLEATYAAKTYRDLVPITFDLPIRGTTPDRSPVARPSASAVPRSPAGVEPTHHVSVGIMSETRRQGVWDVGAEHAATAVMGSVVIDLREARFPAGGEVAITANAVMGSVEVIVNADTAVKVEGVPVMGAYQEGRSRVAANVGDGSPLVRVKGIALMGSVEVKRKGPKGELKRRLLGH